MLVEVDFEDLLQPACEAPGLDHDRPSAIPFPRVRVSRVSEVLGSDPRGLCVYDNVLRMEEPVPFDHVRRTRQPSDLDARVRQSSGDVPFIRIDSAHRSGIQEHADANPRTCRVRQGGCNPLTRECVDADLDGPPRGMQDPKEGPIAVVGREDRGHGAVQVERLEFKGRLPQSIVSHSIPVVRNVPVDPRPVCILEPDRDFSAAHAVRGGPCPSVADVGRISPSEGVDHGPRGVQEEDLVARVGEAKDAALHASRVPRVKGEVRRRERVLCIARRVPCYEEASVRGQDGFRRKRGCRFMIGEGPGRQVDGLGARVSDLHELIVAGGARIDADDQDAAGQLRRKRGGCGTGKRGEGFGRTHRPEGRCQEERRKEEDARRSRHTQVAQRPRRR
jgi:hypothetical protein